MQENHTTSNKTTWPLCCRISYRNSRTRRHLKCKQTKFDSKAGTTARALALKKTSSASRNIGPSIKVSIALAVVPALLSNLFCLQIVRLAPSLDLVMSSGTPPLDSSYLERQSVGSFSEWPR